MLAEQRYRAAILALRDGQWEEAARHLLVLMTDSPGYRNVPEVLMTLEETRTIAYWRAAFAFAMERGALDHAEVAFKKLSRLAPDMADLPQMGDQLQAAQRGEWQPPASSEPAPPEPAEREPQILTADAPQALDDWLSAPEFEQAAAQARDELPTEPWPVADQPAAPPSEKAPEHRKTAPPEPFESRPESFSPYDTPRVLKSALFNDTKPDMNVAGGPVYDALAEPRALKTASFLEETVPHPPTQAESPPVSVSDTKPLAVPVEEPPPSPVYLEEDTEPVPTVPENQVNTWQPSPVAIIEPVSSDEATVESVVPDRIPEDRAHADDLNDLKEAVRARPRRRLDRLVIILLGILLVAVLALAVMLSGRPGESGTIDSFGGVQGSPPPITTPSTEASPAPPDDVQALIRAIDTQLGQENAPETATAALHTLRSVALDLTDDGGPLQQALLAWIETGEEVLNAAVEVVEQCAAGQEKSPACSEAQTTHRLLAEQANLARVLTCSLVECPTY